MSLIRMKSQGWISNYPHPLHHVKGMNLRERQKIIWISEGSLIKVTYLFAHGIIKSVNLDVKRFLVSQMQTRLGR